MSNGIRTELKNGRIFVPFRVLGEAMGLDLNWDSENKIVFFNNRN